MARPIPDLDPMTAAEVATDDSIIIDDTSAGETKRIPVGELLGLPKVGWTATGEVHTFGSWTSATRIGVINVPSNATTKYTPGNRYMFTQTTGGTKYGIIHAVSATTLTVFFPTGTTLTNEAITNPYYSPLDTPSGFDKNEDLYTLQLTDSTERIQGSPAINVWYTPGGLSLAVGVGVWDMSYHIQGGAATGSPTRVDSSVAISTSNATATIDELISSFGMGAVVYHSEQMTRRKTVKLTSPATWYPLIRAGMASMSGMYFENQSVIGSTLIIRAVSKYL